MKWGPQGHFLGIFKEFWAFFGVFFAFFEVFLRFSKIFPFFLRDGRGVLNEITPATWGTPATVLHLVLRCCLTAVAERK